MSQNFFQTVFAKTPKRRAWWIFVVIMVIALIAGLITCGNYYNRFSSFVAGKTNSLVILPKVKDVPFRLGLDLQGGSQLTYEANVKDVAAADRDSAVEGVRDVIERRVNAFGVSEPVISVNKTAEGNYRIIAELAGVKNVADAIKMIGETPLLEFKEQVAKTPVVASTTPDQIKQVNTFNSASKDKASKVLATALKGGDFVALAKANNQSSNGGAGVQNVDVQTASGTPVTASLVATTQNDGSLGFVTDKTQPEIVAAVKGIAKNQVFWNLVETKNDYKIVKLNDKRLGADKKTWEYNVNQISFPKMSAADLASASSDANAVAGDSNVEWKNTTLTGKNLKRTTVEFNQNDGTPEVSLEFDDAGAKLFGEITARNIGKQVAIFLDGYPISVPTVNEEIDGGKAVISGKFTADEAKLLAQRLNTGALPVPITLVSQETVGATLGQQSINNSIMAGLIGLIIVALFMILFYRFPGLLAVFALIIYGLVSLAIFKLWPVTLSLSGIAGFILSIGMAVDANILIFERMKEELRAGKILSLAISDGFNRAWPSIRDSNFTSIIVCLVLVSFSTSIIKGFAITLLLGVLISMFTAIFVTRNFLKLINNNWLEKYKWLVTSVKNNKDIKDINK